MRKREKMAVPRLKNLPLRRRVKLVPTYEESPATVNPRVLVMDFLHDYLRGSDLHWQDVMAEVDRQGGPRKFLNMSGGVSVSTLENLIAKLRARRFPDIPRRKGLPAVGAKDRGQPCKQGETAARSGCVPASSDDGGKQDSKPKDIGDEAVAAGLPDDVAENLRILAEQIGPKEARRELEYQTRLMNEGGEEWEQARAAAVPSEYDHEKTDPNREYAPPPPGEKIVPAPCCLYDPDPTEPNPETGIPDKSRVGVPAMSVPPPPKEIPRLPNLTEKERAAESAFADAYLGDPDGMANRYRKLLADHKVGDAPHIFSTDDAKVLSPDYNPEGADDDAKKDAKAQYNAAVHQTANALAKRAFIHHLDEVVVNLPDEKKVVLVTAGGCAAGKGYALKNIPETAGLMDKAGAVWDAAGEQNATENAWILEECRKRGISTIFSFVHADPMQTWENPKRGVVERANKQGRMVDARLFADSYALGARNFDAFMNQHIDDPDVQFYVMNNATGGNPEKIDRVPEEALRADSDGIYRRAVKVIDERKDQLRASVIRGGTIGERVWGKTKGD